MEELIKEIDKNSTVPSLKAELSDANVEFDNKALKPDLVELVAKLRSGEELPKVGDAEANAELPHQKLAEQLFKQYEKVDVFYITKDGQPFVDKGRAEGHRMGYDAYNRPK